jgi:hypothetical protein
MGRLAPRRAGSSNGGTFGFGQLYNFWMQNDFPYHEIQCLDFAEMPRMPEMDDAYMHDFELNGAEEIETADLRPAARLWELTGTRYLLLDTRGVPLLNAHADPAHHSFHPVFTLRMEPKDPGHPLEDAGDYTVYRDPRGPIALIEYTNVLPRAKLFAHWQTPADGAATLATLASSNFISAQTVLLWPSNTVAQAPGDPAADAGEVEITDYHPKDIKLRAVAKMPAVLLLNERFHPYWSVTVDQKPAPMLRCNYIMRGVFLPAGDHTVEFRFRPSVISLYVTFSAFLVGILLAAWLSWSRFAAKPAAKTP